MQRLIAFVHHSTRSLGLLLLSLLLMLGLASNQQAPRSASGQVKTIVIDAGFGGDDPGSNGAREVCEKQISLAISLKLGQMIKDSMPEIKVLYTRTTDKTLKLSDRPAMANRNEADLFISIHCNSNTSSAPKGSETYFMGLHKTEGNLEVAKRENAAIAYESDYLENQSYGGFDPNSPEAYIIFSLVQNAFLEQSLRLSSLVEQETPKLSPIRSRGVKQAGFLVLWQTSMPSILVETGFISNAEDRAILRSAEGQRNIAKGIFNAVRLYKKQMTAH
ncbi:MAG: N-acetylmuramoyl-L-alanine amidase family protein [Bacteroidia bacterium]